MLQDLYSYNPSLLTWVYLSLGSLTGYWCLWVIYARYFHPLAKYPGPFLASISRTWLAMQIAGANADKTQRRLHQELGPIVRIAPNELSISNPEAIRIIYSINSGFTKVMTRSFDSLVLDVLTDTFKTDFYLPFRPTWAKYPDLFTCLDERLHSSRRKIVNNLYSMSNITRAESSINKCTEVFIAKLADFAESGEVLDMSKWVQMYAFDVIGQLFFSRSFGFLEKGDDHNGYIHSLDSLLPAAVMSSVLPSYVRRALMLVGSLIPSAAKAMKSMDHIEMAAEMSINGRQSITKDQRSDQDKDILSSLSDIVAEKGEKVDFGPKEVKVEVYVALFAGSDTTAAAVSSILYHIVKNPRVYQKLTEEIRSAAKSGSLSLPYVQYSEAAKLPYLDACCKEGMRIHPSVGLTLPRLVPEGGKNLFGEWLPTGTRLGVNAAVIHRDRTVFGEDADHFVPERWFRESADNMSRHMFQDVGTEWVTHNYWFNKPSNVNVRVKKRD